MPDVDRAAKRERSQSQGNDRVRRLSEDDDLLAVDPISDNSTDQREEDDRNRSGQAIQPDLQRGIG